jgi:hypothetical protein
MRLKMLLPDFKITLFKPSDTDERENVLKNSGIRADQRIC